MKLLLSLILATPTIHASMRGSRSYAEEAMVSAGMVTPSSSSRDGSYTTDNDDDVHLCGCSSTETILDWKKLGGDHPLLIYGEDGQDQLGSGENNGNGVLVSSNTGRVAVSSRRHTSRRHGKTAGSVAIYDYDVCTESYELVGDVLYGAHDGEYFGFSFDLATTSSHVAIGAIRYLGDKGSYQGVARIFQLYDSIYPTRWQQVGNELHGDDLLDHFGHSIALSQSGQTVAVGAIQHFGTNNNRGFPGYVKVFRLAQNGDWESLGQKLMGEEDGDKFGNCIAMSASGNLIAVSAPEAKTRAGFVKVFGFDGSHWHQVGDTIVGPEPHDSLGASLDISENGKVLAIGAPLTGLRGAVYIYRLNIQTHHWGLVGESIMGDEDHDQFGSSVSISTDGRRIAIGASHAGTDASGQVKVFDYTDKKWQQVGSTLTSSQPEAHFGSSVSLSVDRLVASAPFADSPTATHAGVVQTWELR
jgi:hypothetical protein